jgi:hypothetical protein
MRFPQLSALKDNVPAALIVHSHAYEISTSGVAHILIQPLRLQGRLIMTWGGKRQGAGRKKGFVFPPEAKAPRGRRHSDETKAKMAAAKRGKPMPSETRAKISAAHRGKKCSAETRAKMSAAKRGKRRLAPDLGSVGITPQFL